jgi:hypothetical protein
MTEIGDTLSTSLLSQVCGQWGLPHEDITPWLAEAQEYWETEAAIKGLHRALVKMKWPQCTDEDTEDEGGGGDRMKRKRPERSRLNGTDKRPKGGSERDAMNDTLKSPSSSSTAGSSSKSSSPI